MTACKEHNKHLCWACIMKARPDLNPPGFYETIDKLYPQEKTNDTRKH